MSTTSSSVDARARVVVATTVLLPFISFWHAAAIVLSDGSSSAGATGVARGRAVEATADAERLHQLWLEAARTVGPDVHHRDVVAAALTGFEDDFRGAAHEIAVARLRAQMKRG